MVSEDSVVPGAAGVLDNVVGGLELSISFAHHSDRERVLEVGRGLGWTEEEDQAGDEQREDELVNLSVTIPKVWLPVHCLLMAGHKHLHKSTYCYLRYKLYDKEAVCSPLKRPTLSEDGQRATAVFEQTRTMELMKHQPLVWYLREEKLEVQIWRSYGKDTGAPRPQDTDRLLGCAYVDLAALSEHTSRTLSVSGVYPLFKHNAPNLWGAAVRVHLCLSSAYHPSPSTRYPSSPEEESLTEDYEENVSKEDPDGRQDDHIQSKKKEQSPISSEGPSSDRGAMEPENTFTANIVVERAMHLSLKGSPLTERAVSAPSCCVSFPVAGSTSPVTTPIVDNTDSPTWNFQHQARLSQELLLDPQQTLVFKVWHKADAERVLGFASVDLSPLLSGFQSVCGWYNIGDFTGQCQGQIKVSITPLENILHLKEEKRVRMEAAPKHNEVIPHPSSLYHTGPPPFGPFTPHPLPHSADLPDVNPEASNRKNMLPSTGHDDHQETLRRFQETVQQAEQNTWSAGHVDALSQSSRTSLLPALRKNLSELDDIQKYFNQKLYRSLPSTEPAEGAPVQNAETKPQSYSEDTETRLLLTKSNLLVTQVSNLISGLQDSRLFREVPSSGRSDPTGHVQHTAHTGHVQHTGALDTCPEPVETDQILGHHEDSDDESDHHRADTPPFSPAGSPAHRQDNMEDLDPPLGDGSFLLGHDFHASSDEEYEENVIEPRTLNEITTITDRTSPWSSVLSDTEPDLLEHNPIRDQTSAADGPAGGDHPQIGHLLYQVDQSSTHSSDGSQDDLGAPSCVHNDIEERRAEHEREVEALGAHTVHQVTSDHGEDGGRDVIEETDLTSADPEIDDTYLHDEESDDRGDQGGQRRSEGDSTHPDTGPSEEEPADPTQPSRHLLSDPMLLPNFFLPPEHLEASMRFLSVSPAVPCDQKLLSVCLYEESKCRK